MDRSPRRWGPLPAFGDFAERVTITGAGRLQSAVIVEFEVKAMVEDRVHESQGPFWAFVQAPA